MTVMEGNITAIPVRILVDYADASRAIHIIKVEKEKLESSESDEI